MKESVEDRTGVVKHVRALRSVDISLLVLNALAIIGSYKFACTCVKLHASSSFQICARAHTQTQAGWWDPKDACLPQDGLCGTSGRRTRALPQLMTLQENEEGMLQDQVSCDGMAILFPRHV